MLLKSSLAALLLAAVSLTACNKSDPEEPVGICGTLPAVYTDSASRPGIAPGGCVPPPDSTSCLGTPCTNDFRMITLAVQDPAGNPVVLDSFVVVGPNGAPLASSNGVPPYGPTGNAGTYALLTDAWVYNHRNQSMSVVARGYLGGKQVVNFSTVVSTDCCHVSGPTPTTVVVSKP